MHQGVANRVVDVGGGEMIWDFGLEGWVCIRVRYQYSWGQNTLLGPYFWTQDWTKLEDWFVKYYIGWEPTRFKGK